MGKEHILNGVKAAGLQSEKSPYPSAWVKNTCSWFHLLILPSWSCVLLKIKANIIHAC